MFDYLMASSPARAQALQRRGLTPNDARALWTLDESEPRPIGSLARTWGCDPANATFIVDRLEKRGLAARKENEQDRRVKLVALTANGALAKRELLQEYRKPPPEMLQLPAKELALLIKSFEKLLGRRGSFP